MIWWRNKREQIDAEAEQAAKPAGPELAFERDFAIVTGNLEAAAVCQREIAMVVWNQTTDGPVETPTLRR